MRKVIASVVLMMIMFATAVETTAQKVMTPPVVMIVPDMIYCKSHGYVASLNNVNNIEEVPDYEKALAEDPTLHSAVTQIAQLITERNSDIVVIDLQEAINLAKEDAQMNSANGSDQSETIEEQIIRNSNADIIIKLQFDLLKSGPSYRVSYTLRGTDAYTGQTFAPLEGVGPNSTSANPVILLREALYGGMDSFLKNILSHYNSMLTKGRMVALDITTTSVSPYNFNSKINDLTLREHIEDFLYDNSVDGGGLDRMKGGESFMQYQGIYIPLTVTIRGRQRRQGAKDVARRLVNHLADLGVDADYKIKGLGKVNIYIR